MYPDGELLDLRATMNKLVTEKNYKNRGIILEEDIASSSIERNMDEWKEELKVHRNSIKQARKAYDV